MARGKSPTSRQWVTLTDQTLEYLEKLAKLGTHGASVPDVAKTLIEAGLRDAIEKKFLKIARTKAIQAVPRRQ